DRPPTALPLLDDVGAQALPAMGAFPADDSPGRPSGIRPDAATLHNLTLLRFSVPVGSGTGCAHRFRIGKSPSALPRSSRQTLLGLAPWQCASAVMVCPYPITLPMNVSYSGIVDCRPCHQIYGITPCCTSPFPITPRNMGKVFFSVMGHFALDIWPISG